MKQTECDGMTYIKQYMYYGIFVRIEKFLLLKFVWVSVIV